MNVTRAFSAKENVKPLVGDEAEIDILQEAGQKGNIAAAPQKKMKLVRPNVADIDQGACYLFHGKACAQLKSLDRFLAMMGQKNCPASFVLTRRILQKKGKKKN